MRDGVQLRADLLRPSSQGRFPTLVYRTPYGKDDALKEYTTFVHAVERGYAVVVQDVRGRYRSAGEFRPYEREGRDGYDTIEWAAQQPWSNGRVGTFGLSYPGAVQWLAAVESPPHLEAMVPAMTFSTPQNFFYSGGVWDLSWLPWIWQSIERRRWNAVKTKMLGALPLDGAVEVEELRTIAPYYNDWLHHPPEDPFWNFAELKNKYGRTRAAVLNFSAWNDDNYGPEGAITNYLGLVASRRGQPSATALLLGPWVHGSDATARTKFGERDFGPTAAIDYDDVVLTWMDRYLRDDPRATVLSGVRYFVMGANQWKTSDTWPPEGRERVFYLSGGEASRRELTSTPPSGTRRAEHVSLRSRRSGAESVRIGRRARLPGAGETSRRVDVRLVAVGARPRSDRTNSRPHPSVVRLLRYRPLGPAARRRPERRRVQSHEPRAGRHPRELP